MKAKDIITLEDARKWLVTRAMEKYKDHPKTIRVGLVADEIGVAEKTVFSWLALWKKEG